ncbi:hypothetical protein PybrP1_007501 [[Pythium] brassicae (nom. inval.)]|nr:hypothetical protein PybrP1_007501 [[Pythium] brassicae (nom. inval.)]
MALPLLLLLVLVLARAGESSADGVDLTTARCHPKSSVYDIVRSECICEPCALCYFRFAAWECRSLANASATDVVVPFADDLLGLEQPLLHADDWFLTEREVAASRGGVPRRDLQTASDGNAVQLFPTTDGFFASVAGDLEALDDARWQVLLTGWSVANVPFRPARRGWQNSTFHALFGRVMRRGVKVRALVWANVLERAQNVAMQHWMNGFHGGGGNDNSSNERAGLLLFDNRLPYPTSSHHQKSLVLSRPGRPAVAYVGGIDLTTDRWDTRAHNRSRLRELRHIARGHDGWVDASVRLEGPAARDVGANFAARWNAEPPPLQAGGEQLVAFDNPVRLPEDLRVALPDGADAGGAGSGEPLGTASVQIVRTFSCKVGYTFAPRGELSLLRSRLKAIARAQNFVYVEDQYFIRVPVLRNALLRQLPRLRALVVVTQRPALGTAAVGYEKLLYEMLGPLRTQFPDKVHVFTTKPALGLYVHTKAVLVDDVFLSVGSGNWNQRSMTSDSEIAANIVDRARTDETPDGIRVAALARAFRLAKFSELSGRSVEELSAMTFFEGVRALELAAASAASVISQLDVRREAYFDLFPDELEAVIDPFDECSE